ncbi:MULTISPECIES: tetratricopeptide repeat protein [Cupriavidus]|uniref:Lipopolysaccharide N-acetylglucosaminyl transferase n=1 Tax=Cupriavidus pauculus TaxID=82633 RepID=A0A3G8H5Y6_9BURK|nr:MULTISPECIES: lipopolysaccharide N-acetylglucosaminyl transferase [Cupriavidus]AZG15605.1 lipopolysaccharide N-acetylglucosaminyl transferase [Cupriavidus pauculus]MDT6962024.1 lipopolysaccharide N-acetylglucosaminyl transferase [Cupriavidus sp. SZY C1]
MGKLTIGGTAIQIAALYLLFRGDTGLPLLLSFLGLQAVAAALLGLALWRLLPRRFRTPFAWSYAYLAAFCFFVPLGGALVCLGSLLFSKLFPKQRDSSGIASIALPEFVTHLIQRVTHGGGARLRAQLGNTRAPLPERMTALVAMQSMPTRTASPVLRELLADSTDDIRLLAYGMLDGAEKQLTQKILAELPRLQAADTPQARLEINKRLADLYWELIYQNLVQGDVYRYTASQVERYASAALEIDDGNAALWYMRGRLALSRNAPGEARDFLGRAEALGFARERVLPLLAEAAYLERDYAAVRRLMAAFDSPSPLPLVRPLLRYWQS